MNIYKFTYSFDKNHYVDFVIACDEKEAWRAFSKERELVNTYSVRIQRFVYTKEPILIDTHFRTIEFIASS